MRQPSNASPRMPRRPAPSRGPSPPPRSASRPRSRAGSPPNDGSNFPPPPAGEGQGWGSMKAMRLRATGEPLQLEDLPIPSPGAQQVLIKVSVCAVCRTDLHIVNGELADPKLPLVIGHMVVGHVAKRGNGANRFAPEVRVGVPWLGFVDETCRFCRR